MWKIIFAISTPRICANLSHSADNDLKSVSTKLSHTKRVTFIFKLYEFFYSWFENLTVRQKRLMGYVSDSSRLSFGTNICDN